MFSMVLSRGQRARRPVVLMTVALVAAAAILVAPPRASALPIAGYPFWDQEQTYSSQLYCVQPYEYSACYSGLAQTVTAGLYGRLASVDLWLSRASYTTQSLTVQIRYLAPTGSLLATSSAVPASAIPVGPSAAWVRFTFASPPLLVRGEVFAIVIPVRPDSPALDPQWSWGKSTYNTYSRGVVWGGSPSGWSSFVDGSDFAFRTLMTTAFAYSTYHPMSPVRLVDSRVPLGLAGKLVANTPRTVKVAGKSGIPANATAVTGNVTVVNPTSGWALYLGPNQVVAPTSSTINFVAGEVAGNGLTVALDQMGTLSVTYISNSGNTTDVVLDITGYFTADFVGATYHPMTPARLLDSRVGNGLTGKLSANTARTFAVGGRAGIPLSAVAVTGNVTAVGSSAGWAVYLGPDPINSPATSTVNFGAGQVKGNNLVVALGDAGTLSATFISSPGNTTDLVLDVTGYYTADATGALFVPIAPSRLVDTRIGFSLPGKLLASTPQTFQVAGQGGVGQVATGVSGNVTIVNPSAGWAAYLGPSPLASPASSTINFAAGVVAGNGLNVALGSGKLSATYMSNPGNTTDLVFDATGFFAPVP